MKAEDLFLEALERATELERTEFLNAACAGDPELRAEVESLLQAHHAAGDFLDEPFIDLEATTPDPDSPPVPGGKLGRFEILRLLGAGGMGQVYLAWDPQLARNIAIKLLSRVHTGNPMWLQRFQREARAAGSVNHPGVLTVFEIGEMGGYHFLVTEFIEGQTLRSLMGERGMDFSQRLNIAQQIVAALGAAHSARIVHRDLKPENIMVRSDGIVKILDFGLARPMDVPGVLGGDSGLNRISRPGSVLGTVHYMSPEQARGLAVDSRSDLFSFGILLFELLSGTHPFSVSEATPTDVLVAILDHEPASLQTLVPEVPPDVERLVQKLLQKDRQERYQTAAELLADLRQVQKESDGQPRRISPGSTPPSGISGGTSTPASFVQTPTRVDAVPEVRYTTSGDVNIAYQVFGEGPIDLVFVMGWVSHLEWFWKEPSFARFLRRLGRLARVILFDKRGTGLSDRVPVHQLPTLEQRMDDVRAVMDAVGSARAVLMGISEGGPMCTLFAATYPEKTLALIMIGSYARRLWSEDYPWGVREEHRRHFLDEIRQNWGGPVGIEDRAPTMAGNPAFREWWAEYLRMGASPGAALALTQMNAQIDIRPVLAIVQVPTLVIHRTSDRCLKVEEGRFLAREIPGARFAEFPGSDHLPFVGRQDEILGEIEEFLTGMREVSGGNLVLATVLAVRLSPVSGSQPDRTASGLIETLTAHVRREVALFRGTEVFFENNVALTTFDGPGRAIRAGLAIATSAQRLGVAIQTGLHTGECDIGSRPLRGTTVNAALQIATIAEVSEVLISGTVKDLVAGAGISLQEIPPMSAAPDGFRLYRVVR